MEIKHSITDDMLKALEDEAIIRWVQLDRLVDHLVHELDDEMRSEAVKSDGQDE
jgi:hypothetical protein